MNLFGYILLLSGIIIGLWYVVRETRTHYRTRPKVYHCLCNKHEFTRPDEHYDDAHVYHGVDLCQPHREMIAPQRKPPPPRR